MKITYFSDSLKFENSTFRFAAYKKYIWWVRNYFGKEVRKVIPSCAICYIWKTFQSKHNTTMFYIESKNEEQQFQNLNDSVIFSRIYNFLYNFIYSLFFVCLFNQNNTDWNVGRHRGFQTVFYKALLQCNFLHDAWKIVVVFLYRKVLLHPVLSYFGI